MPTIEQLEKLLAAEPHDPFVLYAMAQELAKQARDVEAIEFYDRCLAADPHYCYAYFHKARSQEAVRDEEGARQTLRAGLEAAMQAGDQKAVGEIEAYLEGLGG
ncbi:MAG: hypothetical protein R3B57_08245 [Phycisphaerales bacterium]